MNNWKDGIVTISNNMIIHPGYTFDEFKSTSFYSNQDSIEIIYLDGKQEINGKPYMVDLFFREKKLYNLSLLCCEIDFSPKDEIKRKELHDKILAENNLLEKNYFDWGKILSEYDARGHESSINFYYIVT